MPQRSGTHAPSGTDRLSAETQDTYDVSTGGVILLLVVVALFVLTQLYLAIPLFSYVGQDFHAAEAAVSLALATSFSLSYAGGFLVWGPVSDQYGRRPVMLAGLLVLALATCASAFAPSLPWLAGLRVVQGLAAACFAPIALAWLAEAMPPQRRAMAIGAMSTAFLVAGIFGQVLAAWVALHWNWNWVFLTTGICLAISVPLVARMVQDPPRSQISGHLGHRFVALGSVAMKPAALLLSLANITLLLSFVAMYTALGPQLSLLGLDAGKVIMLRLIGLPGMFAALLIGPLAARLGMRGLAVAGFLLAAAGLTLEAVLSHSLSGIAIGSLIFVTGVALAVPAMITQFGLLAAPNRAAGMAINGFVLFVGASIGPLIAAHVPDFPWLLGGLAAAMALAAFSVAGSAAGTSKPRGT